MGERFLVLRKKANESRNLGGVLNEVGLCAETSFLHLVIGINRAVRLAAGKYGDRERHSA
jgi:hypothetical protein